MADLFRRQPSERLRSRNLVRTQTIDAENAIALGFFEAVAAGPVNGSVTVTEAGDSITASGKLFIAASAALTEAGDTLAATGSSAVSGISASVSLTEENDTAVITARLAITGLAALAEGADAVAATGRLAVRAAAAITETGDTVAATGDIENIESSRKSNKPTGLRCRV